MRHESHSTEPAVWSLGCLMVLKNRTDDLEVIDALVPSGYSPPLHRHDFGAESFYVIEGAARFVKGDEEVTLGPGGFVRIPPELPELVAKANGAVLGPPLNRPALALQT
jgi:quercetin dioxygenase-like cupin family protein